MSKELPKPGAKYARYTLPRASSEHEQELPSIEQLPTRSLSSPPAHAASQLPRNALGLDELCRLRQQTLHNRENVYHDTAPLHQHQPTSRKKAAKLQNNNVDDVKKGRCRLSSPHLPIITNQPKKESSLHPVSPGAPRLEHNDSIICQSCGKCRCQSCQTPRPPPQCSCCGDTVLCSCAKMADYLSCMCCVKGAVYHCSGGDHAERPWSCSEDGRCVRWTLLGAAALLLPCLWCFPVLRACSRAADDCYMSVHHDGCRCPGPSLEVRRQLLHPDR